MRIRSIKPEFWRSDDIARLDWHDRLLFVGLWSYVDDNGVGRDEERLIVADLFPLDSSFSEASVRTHEGLMRLQTADLIERYEVDGRRYLHIKTWDRHQRINRPSPGRYPLPTTPNAVIHDTLTEDSVSPHDILSAGSGIREQGNRDQGAGGAGGNAPSTDLALVVDTTASADAPATSTPKTRRGSRLPDGWTPTRSDANLNAEQAYDAQWLTDQLDRFRDYWAGVTGAKGTKLDWDATWRNWIRRSGDEHRRKTRRPDWERMAADLRGDAS